ncbi:hypothetical protein HRbin23_00061 [bacterium HR23]|nr:hypothetical protein HRbin23_00061 [bacterium HR23]
MRKLMTHWRQVSRSQRGITGLETAIILIAFVVVASVFAYTVLSAGIFSSEKGKEAVHSGLKQARGSMELVGGVVAIGNSTSSPSSVAKVRLTVSNALGGEPIDFTAKPNNVVVVDYIDRDQHQANLNWTKTAQGRDDGDDLLEQGEKFQIEVDLSTLSPALGANRTFTIQVKSPTGATLAIERTTPARLDYVMDLN